MLEKNLHAGVIMANLIDICGMKYGRLSVISRGLKMPSGKYKWNVKCDCGKQLSVEGNNLKTGHTRSCGCLPLEQKTTHGMWGTREYTTWRRMKERCLNPNDAGYKYWGGRGIKVCDSWLKFENFFADMGEKPKDMTLERKNNDGNYSPDNCKWATYQEQNNNNRTIKNEKGQFVSLIGD